MLVAGEAMFSFSGEGLESLSRDILAAARDLENEAPATLEVIGKGIEERARENAIAAGSRSIPGTIRGHLVGRLSYSVQAGDQNTPIAILWERGNKGSRVADETFRHPVFGDREDWVDQPRHPFLRPALAQNRRQTTKAMEAMWDRALEPHRLPVEGV